MGLQHRSPGRGAEKRHRAGMVKIHKWLIVLLAHMSGVPVRLWQNAVGGGAVGGGNHASFGLGFSFGLGLWRGSHMHQA